MSTMTKDEFLEQYGDVLVKFTSYYKYTFTFTGLMDNGYSILVRIGGSANDIYKTSVNADAELSVSNLYPDSGVVFDENGLEVDSFDDY